MDEIEGTQEQLVTVLRVERRGKERRELTFAEIIKLARKRGSSPKEVWEGPLGGVRPRRRS